MNIVNVMYIFSRNGGMNMGQADSAAEYKLACGLRDRQIPMDGEALHRMQADSLGLVIQEDGPGFVFNLPEGGAGYVLCAVIYNDSQRCLSPAHVVFGGLDWQLRMQLLPDPRRENPLRLYRSQRRRGRWKDERSYCLAREVYGFPGIHSHQYTREETLNHWVGPGRLLYPGDPPLEGLLLATGQELIPRSYADGDHIKMNIRIFDQKQNSYAAWFHPMVQRSPEEKELMKKFSLLDAARDGKWRATTVAA